MKPLLDHRVNLRLTAEQWARALHVADARGMTITALARKALTDDVGAFFLKAGFAPATATRKPRKTA